MPGDGIQAVLRFGALALLVGVPLVAAFGSRPWQIGALFVVGVALVAAMILTYRSGRALREAVRKDET